MVLSTDPIQTTKKWQTILDPIQPTPWVGCIQPMSVSEMSAMKRTMTCLPKVYCHTETTAIVQQYFCDGIQKGCLFQYCNLQDLLRLWNELASMLPKSQTAYCTSEINTMHSNRLLLESPENSIFHQQQALLEHHHIKICTYSDLQLQTVHSVCLSWYSANVSHMFSAILNCFMPFNVLKLVVCDNLINKRRYDERRHDDVMLTTQSKRIIWCISVWLWECTCTLSPILLLHWLNKQGTC